MKKMNKSSKHPLNMNNKISIAIIANLNENTSIEKIIFVLVINDQ